MTEISNYSELVDRIKALPEDKKKEFYDKFTLNNLVKNLNSHMNLIGSTIDGVEIKTEIDAMYLNQITNYVRSFAVMCNIALSDVNNAMKDALKEIENTVKTNGEKTDTE